MARTVPPRSEVAVEHTWDLESIFPSLGAWDEGFRQVEADIPRLTRFEGRLGAGPDTLREWLEQEQSVYAAALRVYVYAALSHDVDTADSEAAGRYSQALTLLSRLRAAVAFADPELLAIPSERLQRWLDEDEALRTYAHYFDELMAQREHVRSAEVEEVLGLVADPFASARQVHGTLADADLTFEPARTSTGDTVAIAQGNIDDLLADADRELRWTAWEHYADAYLALKNTMAGCLATGVKQHVFSARVRRYPSALEAALAPAHIPTAVYHQLIDTFRRNLPTWHRYWRLRRRALGYDTFHVYDIMAPLVTPAPSVPFEQAVAWIIEGMQPLGGAYIDAMRRGLLEERWVDMYPNRGKRAGAYSHGVQGTHPFILMSYTDDVYSMSTLAHELGHSMHSYFSWQTQPFVYSHYATFVAEVASNFNQDLVRAYLFEANDDPAFQIALIEEALANYHRYFFIMPTLARFELEIHERTERGEPLTAASMIELMTELFREGYGDEVEIDADRIGITWAQFPTHLYSNFYVFQYATGISAAAALAHRVRTEPNAAQQYLAFLCAGSSVYPLDALKLAGVDMTSPEPVERAFAGLAALVDRLEALLTQRTALPA